MQYDISTKNVAADLAVHIKGDYFLHVSGSRKAKQVFDISPGQSQMIP